MNQPITRRAFVKKSAAMAAVSSLALSPGCAKKVEGAMPTRVLGVTGLQVSQLVFGGGSQFLKNEDGDWEAVMERAIELGVNLFDTASNYKWEADKSSEERFGTILPRYRDSAIISTKFEARDRDGAMKEVEASLKAMKTDFIDILMLHSVEKSEDMAMFAEGPFRLMQDLKAQGVARFIGFSSMNSAEKSREILENFDIDVCILAMNPTQYGDFARVALPAARSRNVGVLAMKVMRDIVGVEATARELLSYALSQDGVAGACIGHFGMQTLEENAVIVKALDQPGSEVVDPTKLERRLAHLAGPHALCWARPGYRDGSMC